MSDAPLTDEQMADLREMAATVAVKGPLLVSVLDRIAKAEAEVRRLREALDYYACPGIAECAAGKLKDGSCLRASTGGGCGDIAHIALAPASPPPARQGEKT